MALKTPKRLTAEEFLSKIQDPEEGTHWKLLVQSALDGPILEVTKDGKSEFYFGPDPMDTDTGYYSEFIWHLNQVSSPPAPPLTMHSTPIKEPVNKEIQAEFVQAEHDLMWLAEHGRLRTVSRMLRMLREEQEFQEKH